MKPVKNKRENQRKSCLVPVEGKKGSAFSETQTVDISEGGIGLISNRAIPLDEKIAVEIATDPNAQPILAIGKVVWIRKVGGKNFYRVGLKFQNAFSSRARQKLSRAITL